MCGRDERMGMLDHQKTWHFSVRANPEQCFQTFERAVIHPGFKLVTGKWDLERGAAPVSPGAPPWPARIATCQGRGGVVGVSTAITGGRAGDSARDEEQRAIGSQITFVVSPNASEGRTQCSMWLSKFGTKLGFTTDARFFRSAMHGVEKQLASRLRAWREQNVTPREINKKGGDEHARREEPRAVR